MLAISPTICRELGQAARRARDRAARRLAGRRCTCLGLDLRRNGRACRRSGKPVIVTHGDLARREANLISLESDRIYTTPFTLTGSIGVIDGWIWDAGFSSNRA
jgi:hypothetical protein